MLGRHHAILCRAHNSSFCFSETRKRESNTAAVQQQYVMILPWMALKGRKLRWTVAAAVLLWRWCCVTLLYICFVFRVSKPQNCPTFRGGWKKRKPTNSLIFEVYSPTQNKTKDPPAAEVWKSTYKAQRTKALLTSKTIFVLRRIRLLK